MNPLIVINGKPMPGIKMTALDEMLSPGDIESMYCAKCVIQQLKNMEISERMAL